MGQELFSTHEITKISSPDPKVIYRQGVLLSFPEYSPGQIRNKILIQNPVNKFKRGYSSYKLCNIDYTTSYIVETYLSMKCFSKKST